MRFTGGLPETKCGLGSTLRFTEGLRVTLPAMLRTLGVKRLLDAPCGDLNWISKTDLSMLDEYIGIDNDEEMIKTARAARWDNPPRSIELEAADLLDCHVTCDAVLCRDFFQHITLNQISCVLGGLQAQWLFATNHDCEENVEIDRVGGFRPINLRLPPFSFPPECALIYDGDERDLAIWALKRGTAHKRGALKRGRVAGDR